MNDTPSSRVLRYRGDGAIAAHSPTLDVRVGGGSFRPMTMDTGSLGIVVPLSAIPEYTFVGNGTFGYSSSGRQYTGIYVLATVEVRDPFGEGFVTAGPIEVFGVQTLNGEPLTPEEAEGMGMMGVGIRGLDPRIPSNPFLYLPEMASGEFRTGYILTSRGVCFGYDEAEMDGFGTFATDCAPPGTAGTPLARATLTPSAESGLPPYTNTAPFLLDTGIGYTIVTPPDGTTPPELATGPDGTLAAGVSVAVEVQSDTGEWQSFWPPFVTREISPDAPGSVRLAVPGTGEPGIVNTGRGPLEVCDYLVDVQLGPGGAHGRIGLRPAAGT